MEMLNKKFGAGIEIFVLVLAMFSFSYVIYQSSNVSAIIAPSVCCEKTSGGASCQNALSENECNDNFRISANTCEETGYCNLGCCIDDTQGTYDRNTPQALCQGRWVDDGNCNIPGSELGCCILDENVAFTTQGMCGMYTQQILGVNTAVSWRSDLNELECALIPTSLEKGACIVGSGEERGCQHNTQETCLSLTGNIQSFYQGILCTAPELNTGCEKTEITTCIDGQDEVYFVDSCGNVANIYDSSKINDIEYWKSIVRKENSCNSDSGNGNSESCGNCQRFLGGICASSNEDSFNSDYGDYFCKKTDCTYDGETYQNGESWCVYDGKIGEGDDVIGSRHWRYSCNLGEAQIEPCADYRNQICVQNVEETNRGNFSSATCRVNNWRKCLDLNSDGGNLQECEEESDCFVKSVSFGGSFNFNVCAPNYPPGFNLDGDERRGAEDICGFATRTCTVVYASEDGGSCECVDNCGCEDGGFAGEMNDLCVALGDCGGYVNIEGEVGSGGIGPGESLDASIYSDRAEPVEGQYAEVGDLEEYLEDSGLLNFNDFTDTEEEDPDLWNSGTQTAVAHLGIGLAISTYSWYGVSVGGAAPLGLTGALKAGISGVNLAGSVPGWLGGFANGALTMGIIVGASSLIVSLLGHDPGTTGTLLGGIAGTAAAVSTAYFTGGVSASGLIAATQAAAVATQIGSAGMAAGVTANAANIANMAIAWQSVALETVALEAAGGLGGLGGLFGATLSFWPLAVGIAVAVGIMFLFGPGGLFAEECENKQVTFTCQPWQPPVGGDDCGKCDDDPLKPCSEYRCDSLGTACNLVNKGTGNEKCYDDNPDDSIPPIVDPNLEIVYDDVNYETNTNGFTITNSLGGCLDAYTPLVWGIKTNELAQCKYDLTEKRFEDMNFDFGGYFDEDHITTLVLPDPSHGQSNGLDWDGDLNLYVKCRDTHGNEIPNYYNVDMCVNQGPDLNAPIVRSVLPPNEVYISFNKSEQDVFVFTNEVAECKWSEEDKEYGLMENQFECNENIEGMTIFGYSCNSSVPVGPGNNLYYFRCKDQPWLDDVGRGDERNENKVSFGYSLKKVESPIKITSVVPSEDLDATFIPSTVSFKVQTEDGGDNHRCSFSWFGFDNSAAMIGFRNVYSKSHEDEFILNPGNHKVYVECKDETGDFARKEVEFKVTYDSSVPMIARAFITNNQLKVITTKEAECVYSNDGCGYSFSDGISMGFGEEHSLNAKEGKSYYIKCKGEIGNAPDGCSIVLQPS
jgi:hypothetical protein